MTADEEFRKVAEDVRELARALRGEIRSAKWDAKATARDAKRDWREYRRTGQWPMHPGWYAGWGYGPPSSGVAPGGAPRVDAPPPPGGAGPAAGPTPMPPAGTPTGNPEAGPDGTTATTIPGAATTAGTTWGPGPGAPPAGAPPHHGWGPHPWWPWGPFNGPPPGMHGPPAPPAMRPPRPPRPPGPPPRPPAPPVRHRRDGSTLLSLLLVLVGLAWLGSAAGIVNLSLETVLAAVLVVLGAVMVITARTDWSLSRKHWPVWIGIVLLVVVIASANSGLANGFSSMHFGPTTVTPTSWSDAGTPVANFAGPIRVDLTNLTSPPKGDTTLRVHDVFGPIQIFLPNNPNIHVRVHAHTAFGPVFLPNQARGNGGVFTRRTADYGSISGPTLDLELADAFGPITVTQSPGPTSAKPAPGVPASPNPPDPPTKPTAP